jgi:hypothetical protein
MIKDPGGIYGTNQAYANLQVLNDMSVSGAGVVVGDQDVNGDLTIKGNLTLDGSLVTFVETFAGTAKTLALTDNGHWIYCISTSAVTITCATGLLPGFSCRVIQAGTGKVTIAPGTATLRSRTGLFGANAQYSVIEVMCPVANVFFMTGDIETAYLMME